MKNLIIKILLILAIIIFSFSLFLFTTLITYYYNNDYKMAFMSLISALLSISFGVTILIIMESIKD